MPGVPDLYQGGELWDFSLVDPDNRRPVDLAAPRVGPLGEPICRELAAHWRDGRVKQALIARVLALRRLSPDCSRRATIGRSGCRASGQGR